MVENLQIIMINKTTPQPSLFSSLTDQLNPRHPLYLLANKIDWRRFEEAFSPAILCRQRSSGQTHPPDVRTSDS